jgi:hypothetical protein
MTVRELGAKAVKYGVKWNIIKATFAFGAVCGMLFMAVLLTFTKALAALTGVVQ